MVSHAPGDPPPSNLKHVPAREFRILVPVFLEVMVKADDDLQAEVRAVEAVRAAAFIPPPGHANSLALSAFIAPTHAKHHNPVIGH